MQKFVFRDIDFEWKGETYKVSPSMRLLRDIEGKGISLIDAIQRASEGKPPVSHFATIVAFMLQSAGAKVTEDDVYAELMSGQDQESIAAIFMAVMSALGLTEVDPKKADGLTGHQPTRTAKRKT